MQVLEVDERDSSWEESDARFRVYLHASGADETHGSTATYDITGADLLQVIDWAQRHAGDRLTYAVALVLDHDPNPPPDPSSGRGLIWLVGRDGNDVAADEPALADAQRRMLLRRHDPVRVPSTDRAPLQ